MHSNKYPKIFKSHGKILLSGEYLILNGGWGLVLPTKQYQKIKIIKINKKIIVWKSMDYKHNLWFTCIFYIPSLKIFQTNNINTAIKLQKLLQCIPYENTELFQHNYGFYIETFINFPLKWGLGSSSSLICNISKWANISPFKLLWKYSNGSGYDVASGLHKKPILYQIINKKPNIIKLNKFHPSFIKKLYLLFLNKKQNTNKEIIRYKKYQKINNNHIQKISSITFKILTCNNLETFEKLIIQHENIISKIIKKPIIKNIHFKDYPGIIKSLGAWGGDSLLITKRIGMEQYFAKKGFHCIFPLENIIL